ncbi:hypothetical protein R84B8_01110 [Treponema sp. R8-4-B8]
MALSTDEEQGAQTLVEIIEKTADNPEKAAKRVEEKTGSKGVLGTIFAFIKDYKNRDKTQSNEEWLKQQFAKPEYASAWEGGDGAEAAKAAKALVNDIEDYENAKKSLQSHIEMGGSRASWISQQIEIGAAANGKNLADYAKDIYDGLDEARKENVEFLLGADMIKEAK